jgi:stage II sporulation protein GA (sporulation sigma-E factor processing peptidase)
VVIVYEIYLDIFFVDNMLTNLFVLMAVKLLIGGRVCPIRIILSAGLGALISVAILYGGIGYGLLYISLVMVSDIIMLYIIGIYGRKALIGAIYMNTVAFVYSKLVGCLSRLKGGASQTLILSAVMIITIIYALVHSKFRAKQNVYKVILKDKEESISAKALYDSGNLLTEPISGKPVSIIEKTKALTDWMTNTPEKYKAIPYKSVGNENGMLEGMVIDQLVIQLDNEQVVENNAVIALYDGKISKGGSFSMLLNHDLLKL